MECRPTLLSVLVAASISVSWAQAEPVALIEDISVQRENFQIMDFLDVGTKIDLKGNETLKLGYLNSCIQESIRGGSITVGEQKSFVVGGQVTRKLLTCEGNAKVSATRNKKGDAGAIVFRNTKKAEKTKPVVEKASVKPLTHFTTGGY